MRNLTFTWVGSGAYGGVGKIEPEMSGFKLFCFFWVGEGEAPKSRTAIITRLGDIEELAE